MKQRNKKIIIALVLFLAVCFVVPQVLEKPEVGNFAFDLEAGDNIHDYYNEFTPASTTTDYVDARQSQTYGTTSVLPPGGMGDPSAPPYSGIYEGATPGTTESYWGETSGPSSYYITNNDMHGIQVQAASNAYYITRIKAKLYENSGTHYAKAVITQTTGTILSNGVSNPTAISSAAGPAIFQFNFASSPIVSGGSYYKIWIITDSNMYLYYDSSGFTSYYDLTNSYATPQNPSSTLNSGKSYTIYAYSKPREYWYEAVFRWDTVDYSSYSIWKLYVDFYTTLSGSDDLDFYIGTTTNPTTLVGNDKQNDFNVDVSSYVTGATIYVKIADDYRSGDSTYTSCTIGRMYLYGDTGNTAPTNDGTPSSADLHDTDNLYGKKQDYSIVSYHDDTDGYADIDYIYMYGYSNDRGTMYWQVKYDEDANTFSEQSDASDYITLNTGASSASRSGTTCDVTWEITFNWNHPDVSDIDIRAYVIDSSAESDDDYYEVNWDIETRLDYVTAPNVDDNHGTVDRGDLDAAFYISGTLKYYGSTANVYPPDTAVDVWASAPEYGTTTGPFSDTTLASGVFNITAYSDNAMGSDTWTVKPVIDAAGSGGTSLYYTTDLTDAYITDYIVQDAWVIADLRPSVEENVLIYTTLYLAYDSTYLGSGDLARIYHGASSESMTWSVANSRWEYTAINDDYPSINTLVHQVDFTYGSCEETTHGITKFNGATEDDTIIWDRVQVSSYSIADDRINVGATGTIDVTLVYQYDNAYLTTGTVTLNGISGTHQGSGVWRFTDSEASVVMNTYDTIAIGGDDTYGINYVDQNGQSDTLIWDKILCTASSAADNRDNVGDSVTFTFTFIYDYDDTAVTDGTLSMNGISGSHIGSGEWQFSDSESVVVANTYDTPTFSGNTHGITVYDMQSNSETIIWDRIIVVEIVAGVNRAPIGGYTFVYATLHYEYDDTLVSTGSGTLYGEATTYVSGGWRIYPASATVQLVTYDTVAHSDVTYGISVVNQNGASDYIIWDRIIVVGYTVSDSRDDLNDNVNIDAELHYEYDSTDLTTGTVTINGFSASHQGSGIWRITRTSASVTAVTYNTVAVGGDDTYQIDVVNQNSQSTTVIWDKVTITLEMVYDWTLIGYNLTIHYSGVYQYDSSAFSGTITVNSTGGTFYPSYDTLGTRYFTTTGITDSNYDLTGFQTNTVSGFWDTLECDSITYEWVMYSLNEVQINIMTGTWRFSNGTAVGSGANVIILVNSTSQVDTNTDGSGQIGTQSIAPFGNIWYYANFYGNISISANGGTLAYNWWDVTLEVPVGHTIHLASWTVDEYAEYIWFSWSTVWNNGTFTLWDGDTLITYINADPGTYRLDRSTTYGQHNLTILLNCTDTGGHQSEQSKADQSANDYWLFINYYYYSGQAIAESYACVWNREGEGNIIQIYLYQSTTTWEPFEAGNLIFIQIDLYYVSSGTGWQYAHKAYYYHQRVTDASGCVYYYVDDDEIWDWVTSSSSAYSSYISVNVSPDNSTWQVANELLLLKMANIYTDSSGTLEDDGVHLELTYYLVGPSLSQKDANDIPWLDNVPQWYDKYAYLVTWQIDGQSYAWYTVSTLTSLVIPVFPTEPVNFTVNVLQSMDFNVLVPKMTEDEILITPNLAITVEFWNPLETTIRISGTSNDGFNYYLYLEGVYQNEYGTVSSTDYYSFTVTRTTTTGNHNYAIYCNSSTFSGDRWINFTEYVSDVLYIQDTVYSITDSTVYLSGYATADFTYHLYENLELVQSGSGSSGSFVIEWTRDSTDGDIDWEIRFFTGESHVHPDVISVTTGTYTAGDTTSLQTDDTDYYTLDEVSGAPGFVVEFNFTATSVAEIDLLDLYNGNAGHTVYLQFYDHGTSAWITVHTITDETVFTWHNATVPLGYTFVSGGVIMGRIYHDSSGNPTHDLSIDYIAITTYSTLRRVAGSYYNAPTVLAITDTLYTNSDQYNRLSGETTLGATWTAYDNDSLISTGSISAGSFSITWARQTAKGLHNFGVLFTDGTTNVWKNGSYESSGLLILQIFPGQDNDSIYISGQIYSTDLTLNYWIWEDSGSGNVLLGSGAITLAATTAWFSIEWDKSAENIEANWTLTITDGSNNSTAYGWYTELDSAVTNITNNASFHQDNSVSNTDVIQGDVYDGPSPEAAMWQSFGYIAIVFGAVFLVGASYYYARWRATRRRKRDRGNDWLTQRR